MISVSINPSSIYYSTTNVVVESRSPFSLSSHKLKSPPLRVRVRVRIISRRGGGVLCSSSASSRINHNHEVPKLEPFSRSKLERGIKDPPLIQKSENQLADYCSVLDGEASYDCWKAYFELKDLEKESPKQDVERLIIQAGGMKSLIGCLHGIAEIHKAKKESDYTPKTSSSEQTRVRANCPIPDGLPKSREELEEEEEARMPDSPFTRLLRTKGTHPAWYSPSLD